MKFEWLTRGYTGELYGGEGNIETKMAAQQSTTDCRVAISHVLPKSSGSAIAGR